MKRTWYHYRRESRLRDDAQNKTLTARSRFIFLGQGSPNLPDKAFQNAIWGVHAPITDKNSIIPRQAAEGQKLYLLEITSPPDHDLYVADISVFKALREMTTEPPKDISCKAYDAYYHSLIPFNDYAAGRYQEPEVVCFTPVPFKHIKIVRIIEDFVKPEPCHDMDFDDIFGPD